MAPTKNTRAVVTKPAAAALPLARKGLSKRTQNIQDQNVELIVTRGKRKAENSPLKNDKIKRSALGNLTNNVNTLNLEDDVKHMATKDKITKKKDNIFGISTTNTQQARVEQTAVGTRPAKVITRAATRNLKGVKILDDHTANVAPAAPVQLPIIIQKQEEIESTLPNKQLKPMRRISNEFNKTEDSLYMSALEDISNSESMRLSGNFQEVRRRSAAALYQQQQEKLKTDLEQHSPIELLNDKITSTTSSPNIVIKIPNDVDDFDKANWNDPFQVSNYAMDIFNYLKNRESEFPITDYMEKQVHLSKWMRSLLVDWMVEVQETFELNHETLYLAVKIVDLFLCRVVINKDKLQLLGAAALFIACKFDERTPPFIEDFLYICDGAYKHDELIKMEMTTLKTIDYDLGIPLSYRFLRRYARCAKVPMPTLTLARYILELALMDYATISLSDSKLASAALFMALRLHGEENDAWTSTLEYYTGYKLLEFADVVPVLNSGLHRKPKGTIKTIRSKYSHKIFHEVAKVPMMSTEKLFENTELMNTSIQLDHKTISK